MVEYNFEEDTITNPQLREYAFDFEKDEEDVITNPELRKHTKAIEDIENFGIQRLPMPKEPKFGKQRLPIPMEGKYRFPITQPTGIDIGLKRIMERPREAVPEPEPYVRMPISPQEKVWEEREPSFSERVKDWMVTHVPGFLEGKNLRQRTAQARAQNFVALAKQHGTTPTKIAKRYNEFTKDLRDQPSTMELIEGLITLPIAGGLMMAPGATVLGIGAFMALAEIESYIISKVTGQKYVFGDPKGLTEFLPVDSSDDINTIIDVIDFLGKGAIIAGGRKIPIEKLKTKFLRDISIKYRLPKKVFIEPEKIRSIFGTGEKISANELNLVKSLGLTGKQYRTAIREGVWLEIPIEKLTTISDKPWWQTIKKNLNVKIFEETKIERKPVRGKRPFAGKLEILKKPVTEIPPEPEALKIPPKPGASSPGLKMLDLNKPPVRHQPILAIRTEKGIYYDVDAYQHTDLGHVPGDPVDNGFIIQEKAGKPVYIEREAAIKKGLVEWKVARYRIPKERAELISGKLVVGKVKHPPKLTEEMKKSQRMYDETVKANIKDLDEIYDIAAEKKEITKAAWAVGEKALKDKMLRAALEEHREISAKEAESFMESLKEFLKVY